MYTATEYVYFHGGKEMKNTKRKLTVNNSGIGVVEIILILVVLIALVLIFKDQISQIVEKAFNAITGNADKIIE